MWRAEADALVAVALRLEEASARLTRAGQAVQAEEAAQEVRSQLSALCLLAAPPALAHSHWRVCSPLTPGPNRWIGLGWGLCRRGSAVGGRAWPRRPLMERACRAR